MIRFIFQASVTGVTWAEVSGESVIVTIGGNGQMAVWDPKELAVKMHILSHFNDLTAVQTVPHALDEAIVAADKVIVHVSLKGSIFFNS